jgi:aspartyl-tRNA(Asn)/glutamyl-tRNA(Gln) amidotransferase subunit A
LRPTYGTVSRYGIVAFASSLDQIGPIAKTVRDCALLYRIVAGRDPCDSTTVELPQPIELPEAEDLRGLRIGVPKELNETEGIEPGVTERVNAALGLAQELGAEVGECSLPRSVDFGLPCYYLIAPSEASSNLARYDGVRYGFRAKGNGDIRSLYARTRDEGFGGLLRGLLRPGAEGPNADQAGARRVVRALRPACLTNLANSRLPPRRTDREPASDVPL